MQRKEPPTDFARAVRDARDEANLTQTNLATVLGVAPSTIYRIEQGHAPSDDVEAKLRKWCRKGLPDIAADAPTDHTPSKTGTDEG